MPENLRILNDEGRRRWRQWIEDLRPDPSLPVPSDLLANPETSLSPPTAVQLPAGPFGTKFEMAMQLLPAVIALETSRLPDASWPGVWDALALTYFEEICPSVTGKRRVKELESYVWSPLYTRSYKHRVAGTISLYRAYGRASILCLWGEVPILSDYEIQLSSHPSWLGAKAVGEVLYQMYWEHDSGRPKRGGMSRVRPGALFHFIKVVSHLERTYDIQGLKAEALKELLPVAFHRWFSNQSLNLFSGRVMETSVPEADFISEPDSPQSFSTSGLEVGRLYSREALASMWGYKSFHPLARGVVTPKSSNTIILFVSGGENESANGGYNNALIGDQLFWEGPRDHFAESRIISSKSSADKIILFWRDVHRSDFSYKGEIEVASFELSQAEPSKFVFRVKSVI